MSDMERIVCILIGYAFGLFQSGYLLGKLHGIDIRKEGSGNSGTTNALRVMGVKAGLLVFAGDVIKLFAAAFVTHLIFSPGRWHDPYSMILILYTAIGAVLGHNYPFYLSFKGGKGIAVTAALVLLFGDLRIILPCLAAFAGAVLITGFVSLGSLLVVTLFVILWAALGMTGNLPLSGTPYFTESMIIILFWAALAFWRHRSNIRRLAAGTENKISLHKKRS